LKISVIIPTYIHGERTIDRLLLTVKGYLLQTLENEKYEIIVVDDGSSVDIKQCLENEFGVANNLTVLKQDHQGMCMAVNKGASKAVGDYILIGVDDNVPLYDALEKMMFHIQNNHIIYTGFMGQEWWLLHVTRIKNLFTSEFFRDDNAEIFKEQYKEAFQKFPVITVDDIENRMDEILELAKVPVGYQQFEEIINNDLYSGFHWTCVRPGALGFERKTFIELGGFDVNFDPSGWYSDIEFGYRLYKKGYKVKMVPDSKFVHLNHLKLELTFDIEEKCFDYLIEKHPDPALVLLPFLWQSFQYEPYIKTVKRVSKYLDVKNKLM